MTESRMATTEELATLKRHETVPMFNDLPIDNVPAPKKHRDFKNMLSVQMNRLMNYKRIEAADIHRATGISFSTLGDWVLGGVEVQMLDDNIKKLARYFGCTVDYLAYGTPETEWDLELENRMPTLEEEFIP